MPADAKRKALPDSDPGNFHSGWDGWVLANIARGVSPLTIKQRLLDRGFDEGVVIQRIAYWTTSPALLAAREYVARIIKLEGLLNVLGEIRALDDETIPRVTHCTAATFYETYVHRNRPVVMTAFARQWPALRKWTLPYLSGTLGDLEVEVTADREEDSRFEDNFRQHVRRCRFSDFIAAIRSAGTSNDRYLVAKNNLLKHPAASPLLKDFPVPVGYLDPSAAPAEASLWIGPRGTLTPLHHDACNILFTQIQGRKRVRLVAPVYLPRIYNDRNCFTSFDPESPDHERFPRMKGVPIPSLDLSPGDTLFIPVGWWHHVRALDVSISLSLTRFMIPRKAHVWSWRD